MSKMMLKTVFKIIGYEVKSPAGDFMESVIFWIFAENEAEAMEKLKAKGITCNHYQTTEVIEKYEDVDNTN